MKWFLTLNDRDRNLYFLINMYLRSLREADKVISDGTWIGNDLAFAVNLSLGAEEETAGHN